MTDFTAQLPLHAYQALAYICALGLTLLLFFAFLLSSKKITSKDLEGRLFMYASAKNLQISFGTSENWRYLREMTFKIQGKRCLKCGKEHASMHVDHIYPKSTYPHLEYMIDNLQVLCPECNKKKSFTKIEDHRKPEHLMSLLREIDSNKLLQKKYVYDKGELLRLTKNRFKKDLDDKMGIFPMANVFKF